MPRNKYLALVKQFPLRPIRSEADLDAATDVLNQLNVKDLTPEESDYFEVLTQLVHNYEEEHYADLFAPTSDADMLNFLIEQSGKSQRTVARETGIALSTINAITHGKRRLTRSQVAKLADYFHVGVAVFSESPATPPRRSNGKRKPLKSRS